MKERVDRSECIVNRLQDLRDIDLTKPEDYRLALQLKAVIQNGVPCSLQMSRHHKLYKSEGGKDTPENLLDMCMGHQQFIHASYKWDSEDFSYLKRLKKSKRKYARK